MDATTIQAWERDGAEQAATPTTYASLDSYRLRGDVVFSCVIGMYHVHTRRRSLTLDTSTRTAMIADRPHPARQISWPETIADVTRLLRQEMDL